MAHHKRGKPKNARAGCLMCKPHKANSAKFAQTNQEKRAAPALDEGLEEEYLGSVEREVEATKCGACGDGNC